MLCSHLTVADVPLTEISSFPVTTCKPGKEIRLAALLHNFIIISNYILYQLCTSYTHFFSGVVFPDGSVDTISISASLAALSDELESGGFSITETNWNRSHLVQKLVPFIKRICRVKNCSDVSINPCTSGWFFLPGVPG